ncbi:MAG: 16S rRNA processing protein RimM [Ruminococcaceae bacterium]|nr:16S rRNA processing protein RimM [Oscillospiraceae bacterium]
MIKYLEAGKLINTHGVRGEFKFDVWCDTQSSYLKVKRFYLFDNGEGELEVEAIRKFGKFMLVKFKGIDSLDDALKFKSKTVYVDRDDVPKKDGAVFIADIIGLPAIDISNGNVFGKIIDSTDRGSGDLYEIQLDSSKTVFIPAIPVFVKKIDLESGVYFELIEGLID